MTVVRRLARPMLSAIFVQSGFDAVRHPGVRAVKAGPVVSRLSDPLTKAGLPTDPETLVRINGATMVAAGTMLATGRFPRLAALTLAGSLVPTTLAGHRFWEETDPAAKSGQRLHFLKNVGLVGGLLLAAVDTEGKPGLAWRTSHAGSRAQAGAKRNARRLRHEARREAKLAAARIG